jgi:hypothetical protein
MRESGKFMAFILGLMAKWKEKGNTHMPTEINMKGII